MADVLFLEIGIVIIAAMILGFIAKKIKQPLIPAYITAGLIIGPILFIISSYPYVQNLFGLSGAINLIGNKETILSLSEIGIAFLLFLIGLKINVSKLKEVGYVVTIGGVITSSLMFAIGFGSAILLGFSQLQSAYLAFLLVFSSTMVIVNVLSQKRQVNSLHGRIIIGFLLIQDLIAIFALLFLSSISTHVPLDKTLFKLIIGSALLLVIVFISGKLLPRIFLFAAKSKELLFLASIGICFLYAIIFNHFGFSIAIGAFIAGVLLGSLPYHVEIIGRVKSLHDFFIILFFVLLGFKPYIFKFTDVLPAFFVFLFLILIVKPVINALIVGLFGYKRKTIFQTTNPIMQVSEFSLILATQGLILGHINNSIFSLVVMLTIITITLTSYFTKYEEYTYKIFTPLLILLEKIGKGRKSYEFVPNEIKKDVVLCGYDRIGFAILNKLTKIRSKDNILVIDFNPKVIEMLQKEKIPYLYADIANPEIIDRIDFSSIKVLISTIPDKDASLMLVKEAQKYHNKKRIIILTAQTTLEALDLYRHGADYVILPYYLSGDYASLLIDHINLREIHKMRNRHIKELHKIHHLHIGSGTSD